MKKIIVLGVVVFLIIASVCFGLRSSVNNKIESKIQELNKNGFVVKHEQSFENFKTKGTGQIEVVYPQKVASYLINKIEDENLKKSLEKQFSLFDRITKDELFEGVTFDYDYTINNFSSTLDLNIYLTKISTKASYNMAQTYAYSTNPQEKYWLESLLKDKKIHLNIDENGNFKLADLSFVVPNESFFTLREISGNKNFLKIGLFKVSDTYLDTYTKSNLIVDNITMNYDLNQNKKSSKISVENIEYKSYENKFRTKNIVIDSNSLQDELNISSNSKFSFDEVVVEKLDTITYKNMKMADLKKTSFEIAFDKIPFKKYEEMINSLSLENKTDFMKQYDEFIKALSSNGISITSKGEANNYNISDKTYFDVLKYDLALSLNKNIPAIQDIKSINDIFSVAKVTFDVDNKSALELTKDLNKKDSVITLIDTVDNNLKRLEAELKSDGLYINGVKVLEEKDLQLTSFNSSEEYEQNISVTHTYELIDKNTLRVNFKYKPNMEVISAGGISVSFPQLKDASKIKANKTNSFKKIDYYPAGKEIYSGMLEKNIKTEYLMVEGWDDNWTDPLLEKEFSLDIDIKDLKNSYLEINLRAGALNEKDATKKSSEIVPNDTQSYTKDQQSYPVTIADIDLYSLTNSAK